MTKKIYLETFKKCPGSLCFPLLVFGDGLFELIYHHLWKIQGIDSASVILFQVKVFERKIKETTLARYSIKLTTRPSST